MENKINGSWMIYGATGFTGTLIAEEAVRHGLSPVLAGRNAEKLRNLAERLGLRWVSFSLDDESALREAAESVDLMLHAAGRFAETSTRMMDACLAAKSHYLDISNEISVLQAAKSRHHLAEQNGVSIIPGVGFGTVASSCLARHVCEQISEPILLEIVISPYVSQRSVGAIKSTLETIALGGYVRRNGVLVGTPFGFGAKRIRAHDMAGNVLPVPSGDLEAAYLATGIANITVFMTMPFSPILARRILPLAQKLLSWSSLRELIFSWLDRRPTSSLMKPVDTNRRSWLWARAVDCHGNAVEARLEAGEGYMFTASASVLAVKWVLERQSAGAHFPATVFGAEFVLQIEGTQMHGISKSTRTDYGYRT